MPFIPELGVEPGILLVLALVAFTAGFIDAIAGGGGLLTIPALLTAGLPPHLVLGTNKLCATFGSATASYTFYRRKLFNPGQWRNALIGTAIGALLGAALAQWLPSAWLNQMLPAVVFACGLYLLFGRTPETGPTTDQPIATRRQWPQSLGLGFYDGVAGPGTGAFWTVSSLLLYPLDLLRASGVARSMNFVSNACALMVFIISGQVAWLLGISMGLALMAGAFIGARTAIKGGSKFIRPVFILVVLALTARLAWQHWFGQGL
ncbi:TSUP family transporter [Pseudomonas xionganensis]|uniref:Probable membrane transporter protein n=1 Tax=Pseudomonas xionganensis TaxID=2654845 RepID=A0A6I4KW90_9PSED|nr:TSUP family transporter [Pseudomonas xionganensis]MVW75951.1 TSUP family transporter [Pseudomonas xionganensis]